MSVPVFYFDCFCGISGDYCGVGCRVISALSAEALRRMILLPLPQMGRVKLPDNVRKELDLIIYEYAEYSFEQIIKVRGK